MKLYWIESEHRYVHRKDDIPKGANSEVHDIPTDLAGLMGFLNELHQAHQMDLCNTVVDFAAEHDVQTAGVQMVVQGAANMFIDQEHHDNTEPANYGVSEPAVRAIGQTEVEEAIQAATPAQLASYAQNVCWRIKELLPK